MEALLPAVKFLLYAIGAYFLIGVSIVALTLIGAGILFCILAWKER